MNKINNIGPSIEPCGIPLEQEREKDNIRMINFYLLGSTH